MWWWAMCIQEGALASNVQGPVWRSQEVCRTASTGQGD